KLNDLFHQVSQFMLFTQHTPGPGVSCLRSSPADGHTLLTFLSHGANGARFLYLTKWSDDLRLAGCEIYSNPDVAAGYRAFCDRNETWDQELVKKFSISLLLFPDAPCALVRSVVPTPELTGRRRTDETERKTRRKRSWIFPGTLWCGTGSKAAGYEQLGMFERADKCCREHDHCSDIIPAFTVNYGVFNPNFFTVSHCECDQRFRQCLLGMNDSISSMVGYSFFNILKVPCFELKQLKHCTQMYWWGMTKANGCKRQEKLSGEGPSQKPKTVKKVHISTRKRGDKMKKRRKDFSDGAQKSNIPPAIPATTSTQISPKAIPLHFPALTRRLNFQEDSTNVKGLLCRSLKHLDDCKFKIPPLAKKYNLTNMKSKTAYHCDCTSRLAVQIKNVKKPSPPRSLLREFVSQDCFTLPKENKCNRTKRYQALKFLSKQRILSEAYTQIVCTTS
uniref:phospholipase A2 n=1 Tax=Poecilia latipinna TaxID=48699 RepID=A0A3B3VCR0_9TELE